MKILFKNGEALKKEIEGISNKIRSIVFGELKRDGVVVGISGGIDSAVVAALAVKALGNEKVLGVILPEKDSNESSKRLGIEIAEKLGIKYEIQDITNQLEGFGVYNKIDSIIKKYYENFDSTFKYKIIIPNNILEKRMLSLYYIVIEDKLGNEVTRKRLNYYDYKEIQASLSIKLRTRMVNLYYHAERNGYLVAGTTNRTEYDEGNFCKHGDGGVDFEVISHLYKTEVYECARMLDIPQEIIDRPPSPDTCSSFVTDEEFYFSLKISILDKLLYGYNNNLDIKELSDELAITEEQVQDVFKDINNKQKNTMHLKVMPITCEQ